MKSYFIVVVILFSSASCKFNRVDSSVDTLRIEAALPSSTTREVDMAVQLYRHYTQSDKSKEFYEVISGDRGGILNYWPDKQLLTVCADPGSNWLGQFKEVDAAKLKWIGDDGIIFGKYHDTLTVNRPFVEPKTNGNPTIR